MDVKKKILIKGEKVHDVGYRLLLTNLADDLGIENFNAKNIKEEGRQAVRVLVGSSSGNVNKFFNLVKEAENFPEHAKVDPGSITIEDYDGYVGKLDSFRMRFVTDQQYKIASTGVGLLKVQEGMLTEMKGLRSTQEGTLDEMKGLKSEMHEFRTDTKEDFNTINTKYDAMSRNTNKIFIELVKGREELVKERHEFKKSMEKAQKASDKRIEKLVEAILASKESK